MTMSVGGGRFNRGARNGLGPRETKKKKNPRGKRLDRSVKAHGAEDFPGTVAAVGDVGCEADSAGGRFGWGSILSISFFASSHASKF